MFTASARGAQLTVGMAREIERKYLLSGLPDGLAWTSEQPVRQGYVALDGETEVRVRLRPGSAELTIKHGSGRVRVEEQLELDERQAEALWGLTGERRIEKTRRTVTVGGHEVEVDEYGGELAGLLVAEVEFPDEATASRFQPPRWFGREVTGEPGYGNRDLACRGRPEEHA